MTTDYRTPERSSGIRHSTDGLLADVRQRGRLARLTGMAVDFNRHGMALITDQPLPQDCYVYINLVGYGRSLGDLVGVVHNCTSTSTGFRCGIQFRPTSHLQDDANRAAQVLLELEQIIKQETLVLDSVI